MVKRITICIFLIIGVLPIFLKGQTNQLDSLKKRIAVSENDSTLINLYLEISDVYGRKQNDSALVFLEKADGLVEGKTVSQTWWQIRKGDIIRNKGNSFYFKNQFTEAINFFLLSAEQYQIAASNSSGLLAEEANTALAKLFVNMGVTYTTLGNYDKALEKYYSALAVYEKVKDSGGMASCHLGIGNLLYYQQEYDNATSNLLKGADLYERVGNIRGIVNCNNTLGMISFHKKDWPKTLEYFYAVLEKRIALKDQKGISAAYTNLANVYMETGGYQKAINYLNKSLVIDEKIGDMYGVSIVQINIAKLFDKMATSENIDSETRKYYFNQALQYSQNAFDIAEQMEVLPLINYIADVLFKVNRSLENFEEANRYFEIYNSSKDSLMNEEKTKAIAEMQTRYESEKKEQQIELLSIEKKRQKVVIYTTTIILFLVMIFSVFLYILILQKNRVNRLLAHQQEQIITQNASLQQANEEILAQRDEIMAQRDLVMMQKEQLEMAHHQLTDSLIYAQSIQAAILPTEKMLEQISSSYFLIIKPCELVSGDFFWATSFNEYQVFCVSDCTGHGVPGAFMSILGITALNDIVSRHRVTDPAEILGYLRESVIETLSQNDHERMHKDGMDMALCVLNTKTKVLQFAGAGLPLWLVAEEAEDVKSECPSQPIKEGDYNLCEIKGDIMPVGQSPLSKPFKNHTINLEGKRVTVYLTTDGFADQMGEKGKYGVKKFKKAILENCGKDFQTQKDTFEDIFMSWKGENYQIDDVTFLGLRIDG
jgi:serine phosphatase RsbU (regulator of sigma subunit)